MIDSTALANAVEKWRERQFASGDLNRGVDCVNLLLGLYEEIGFVMPVEFEGVTREDYANLYQTDRPKANEIWNRFLMSLGTEIGKENFARGDILILKAEGSNELSMAIALGNGSALVVTERLGCKVIPVRVIKRFFYSVRRLCQ